MTHRTSETPTIRVQAEPSEIIVFLDGVECRVWNGITETGEQVFLFVHRVSSPSTIAALLERVQPTSMKAKDEDEKEG